MIQYSSIYLLLSLIPVSLLFAIDLPRGCDGVVAPLTKYAIEIEASRWYFFLGYFNFSTIQVTSKFMI
jgi:hypothetical protein